MGMVLRGTTDSNAEKLGWAGVECPFGGFVVSKKWKETKVEEVRNGEGGEETSLGHPDVDRYRSL